MILVKSVPVGLELGLIDRSLVFTLHLAHLVHHILGESTDLLLGEGAALVGVNLSEGVAGDKLDLFFSHRHFILFYL